MLSFDIFYNFAFPEGEIRPHKENSTTDCLADEAKNGLGLLKIGGDYTTWIKMVVAMTN